MAQETAVEWLVEQLKKRGYAGEFPPHLLFEQAKQMEKEQHEQTWNAAHQAGRFEGKGIAEENWQTFRQYYNETYKP